MSLETQYFYDFAGFRIDPDERILLRDGVPLPLTPKAFHMLLVLVENHGRIVEKEKLMTEIWADSFVEEGSLSVNARKLRQVLGDDANEPKFIETIPRRGYRFIADVKESVVDIAPNEKLNKNVPAPLQPAAAKWYLPIAAVLLLFTGAVIYYFGFARTSAVAENRSIAVLPLRPIDAATRDVIYEIGIAESLIHRLSSMKGFVVRPLSSTRAYTNLDQDPLEAGREQKVDFLLASNYQLADGKIRFTAQLFNVATGQIDETYKSEKDAANIFAMQDAIASDVGSMFQALFATSSGSSTAKRQTTNEDAYRLYLQGMYLNDKRNIANARKAVVLLQQAVTLDPDYAEAWAAKAHAHRAVANFGRSANTHDEYHKSTEAVRKALSLDENLADAHSALCENLMSYDYDLDRAGPECVRAVELDPGSSLSHHIYGRYLMSRGRFDEATAELKIAIDLDPASIFNHFVYGVSFLYARRYDEAVVQLKRVVEMDRNVSAAYPWLLSALALQGNRTEPFDWFEKFPGQFVAGEPTAQVYKSAYQASGWDGVFREWVKRFDEVDMGFGWGAFANGQIGDTEKAFEYLEKAYQRREWGLALLQVDPRLDSLRGDPRFDDLLKRVESR
ncbi:MAG: winged helix-turn-helix domain-containing protein [Saprospiraceae bacterium]|nr:winged helix-turn-helix domain-containing protein [Pyrinomonadaceae bacterium]